MSAEHQIRDRVSQFIADHHRWAMQFYSGDPSNPFNGINRDASRVALGAMLTPHCTAQWVENQLRGFAMCWPPQHDPAHEEISSIEVESACSAVVIATRVDPRVGARSCYFEFELSNTDDGWRISGTEQYYSDPNAPITRQPDLLQFSNWRPEMFPADDYSDGVEKLFSGEASVATADGVRKAVSKRAGEIAVPSGYLVCSDPSLWEHDSYILDLPIPPGRYPVDLVIDETSGRVAAARVLFNVSGVPARKVWATRWEKPALPASGDDHRIDSHYVATDTAAIGLVDAGALLPLTRRKRNTLVRELSDRRTGPTGSGYASTILNDSVNAIAIDSGWGDGIYPSFWLLGLDNQPLQLIFDFGVLGQPVYRDVQVPFNLKRHAFTAKTPELDSIGVSVRFFKQDDSPALQIKAGPAVNSIKAFDERGRAMFDSKDLDSDIDDDDHEYYLLPEAIQANASGHLDIRFYLKNRYEVVS